jgi:phage anti-repressor protein
MDANNEQFQQLLVNDFTSEEQLIFLKNFRCYLSNDPDQDFVIDLEKVCEWIGFARKHHAKRLLQKYFFENTHYKTMLNSLTPKGERVQPIHGGQNKETILMTPNAFKDFCMRADTQKSKEIRNYYIKMERVVFKSMENVLQKSKEELQTVSEKVTQLEKELKRYRGREKKKYAVEDVVYIVHERGSIPNLFKVGSTDNMNLRDKQYYTHSNQCVVVYLKKCKDRRTIEQAIHTRFSKYSYNFRPDWFQIPFDTLRKGVDEIQLILEGETSPGYTMEEEAFNEISETPIIQQDNTAKIDEPTVTSEPTKTLQDVSEECEIGNNHDFDKFILDCYETVPRHKSSWVEIGARFRLWSKSTENHRGELADYLQNKGFKKTFLVDENTQCKVYCYQGLRMKPLEPFNLNDSSIEAERFLYDCCEVCVTGRITIKQLRAAYHDWKKQLDPTYERVKKVDLDKVKDYCKTRFLSSTVHDGTRIRPGFYGFCLKGLTHVGIKMKTNNRKSIQKIHPLTQEVLEEFESLEIAARVLGTTASALSKSISNNKSHRGFLFKRKENECLKDNIVL